MSEEAKKQKTKRRVVRVTARLFHKRDLANWDELIASDEYKELDASELMRQALHALNQKRGLQEMLEEQEKRHAASFRALHKKFDGLETSQQVMLQMFEVLMRAYYFHTLPVPKEAIPQAIADANRRIEKFFEDVANGLQHGGTSTELAIKLSEG